MVKVGFICEGETERIIIGSSQFREFLRSLNIERIETVIDAGGNGNLLPKYLDGYTKVLVELGADKIVIVTDREDYPCITSVKERINAPQGHFVIVAVQQFEAWFLADTTAMKGLLKEGQFICDRPESYEVPFDEIRTQLKARDLRGPGRISGKVTLAKWMLDYYNFSIARAAEHPNCPSAAYFMQKLTSIAQSTNN